MIKWNQHCLLKRKQTVVYRVKVAGFVDLSNCLDLLPLWTLWPGFDPNVVQILIKFAEINCDKQLVMLIFQLGPIETSRRGRRQWNLKQLKTM